MHPVVGSIWSSFFERCPASVSVERIVVGNVAAVESLSPARFVPTRWKNARFSVDMLRIMDSGAAEAQRDSTVVFVSDSSVPLRPCADFAVLEGRTTARISMMAFPPCIKGSQWISLTAAEWHRAFTSALIAGQPFHCRHIAPDETMVHAVLWHDASRVDNDTHAVFWDAVPIGGHPQTLTEAQLKSARARGFLMARKFDPEAAIYDFSYIHNDGGATSVYPAQDAG